MFFYTLIGLVVAAVSFGIMEFVVLKRYREHTLPCLLVAVGGGLLLAVAFGDPGGTLYQMGWMLGMCVCVLLGFARRGKRSK